MQSDPSCSFERITAAYDQVIAFPADWRAHLCYGACCSYRHLHWCKDDLLLLVLTYMIDIVDPVCLLQNGRQLLSCSPGDLV